MECRRPTPRRPSAPRQRGLPGRRVQPRAQTPHGAQRGAGPPSARTAAPSPGRRGRRPGASAASAGRTTPAHLPTWPWGWGCRRRCWPRPGARRPRRGRGAARRRRRRRGARAAAAGRRSRRSRSSCPSRGCGGRRGGAPRGPGGGEGGGGSAPHMAAAGAGWGALARLRGPGCGARRGQRASGRRRHARPALTAAAAAAAPHVGGFPRMHLPPAARPRPRPGPAPRRPRPPLSGRGWPGAAPGREGGTEGRAGSGNPEGLPALGRACPGDVRAPRRVGRAAPAVAAPGRWGGTPRGEPRRGLVGARPGARYLTPRVILSDSELGYRIALAFSAPGSKPETAERADLQFRWLLSCPKLAGLQDFVPAVRGDLYSKRFKFKRIIFQSSLKRPFPGALIDCPHPHRGDFLSGFQNLLSRDKYGLFID